MHEKLTITFLTSLTYFKSLSSQTTISPVLFLSCSKPLSKVTSRCLLLDAVPPCTKLNATPSPGKASNSTLSGLKTAQCGSRLPGIPALVLENETFRDWERKAVNYFYDNFHNRKYNFCDTINRLHNLF